MTPRRWMHAGVAAFYFALALVAMRAVLPAPAELLAIQAGIEERRQPLGRSDTRWSTWVVSHHARAIATGEWNLFDPGVCWPMRGALAFGEHALGVGVLGVVPWLLTHDPIVTMNAVVILLLWINALCAYALVLGLTGSVAAGLVAGVLLGFHAAPLADPGHPFLFWVGPSCLALLCAERLFTDGRWRWAWGLGAALAAALLGSFYQVLALVFVGSVFGVALALRHWRRLPALSAKLLVAAGCAAGMIAVVFGPYLATRARWDTLDVQGFHYMNLFWWFGPGQTWWPGPVAMTLTALALLDRLRGSRGPHDHRLALALGGLLAFWASSHGVTLPGGFWLRSPLLMLEDVLPGLRSVRALSIVAYGTILAASVLAGYGIAALVSGRSRTWTLVVVLIATSATLRERFHAPTSSWAFNVSNEYQTFAAEPDPDQRALLAKLPAGAVLDVPFYENLLIRLERMAHYQLEQSWHHQPTAACYNSFRPGTLQQMYALAGQLGDSGALGELYALGFRSLVVHREGLRPGAWQPEEREIARAIARGHLVPIGVARDHRAFALRPPPLPLAGFEVLGRAHETAVLSAVAGQPAEVMVELRNASTSVFRHPDPIQPSEIVARWSGPDGTALATDARRVLLPAALRPGGVWRQPLTVEVPADLPATATLTIARTAAPERSLGEWLVTRTPGS